MSGVCRLSPWITLQLDALIFIVPSPHSPSSALLPSNDSRGWWSSGQAAPPAVSEERPQEPPSLPSLLQPSANVRAYVRECVCLYTVFKSRMAAKAQSQQTRNNFHMKLQHTRYLGWMVLLLPEDQAFVCFGLLFCFVFALHRGINTMWPRVTSSASPTMFENHSVGWLLWFVWDSFDSRD